jgi:Insertion element 4 transposase N-terminal/Transposase DDE domain
MARTKATLSDGARLGDYLSVAYLAMNCPLERVHAALVEHSAENKRRRGLPREVLVYFVMAMCLHGSIAYEEVLRLVVEGLRESWGDDDIADVVVTKGAISQARHRVGVAPLRQLYQEQVKPMGPAGMVGVWYRGYRLMAADGSTLDMPDEAENARHFGYPGASRGSTAFPQLRFVSLVECGTHILCHSQVGPYAQSEAALFAPLWVHIDPTMPLMADRAFFSHDAWQRGPQSGAQLLFRMKRNQRLPRERELPDGSYLTMLHANEKDRRHGRCGTVARIIEYTLEGIPNAEPSYRLLTNWLDHEQAPAAELAALYHQRWTIEETFDELKTHLADRRVVLRSKTPTLVEQEFYALLLAHAAIRRLMVQAAQATQQAAKDLSFLHAVRVFKRRLPAAAAIPPCAARGMVVQLAQGNRRAAGNDQSRETQSARRETKNEQIQHSQAVRSHQSALRSFGENYYLNSIGSTSAMHIRTSWYSSAIAARQRYSMRMRST